MESTFTGARSVNHKAPKQTRAQAKSFTKAAAKEALWARRLTIEALSRKLKPARPRSTVSKAINQYRFPLVRQQIKKALKLS